MRIKKILVSTIFPGMGDFSNGDIPYFETGVINRSDFNMIKEERTNTWDEAMALHKKMVEKYLH